MPSRIYFCPLRYIFALSDIFLPSRKYFCPLGYIFAVSDIFLPSRIYFCPLGYISIPLEYITEGFALSNYTARQRERRTGSYIIYIIYKYICCHLYAYDEIPMEIKFVCIPCSTIYMHISDFFNSNYEKTTNPCLKFTAS